MVNCNPETVSTDYDTSDRLYFEPLSPEEVLAVLDREKPVGVVTQFGGQTPLRLARHIEAGGYRILGTPHAAIDLAEDREQFGALARELGVRCPPWATVESVEEALAAAREIGYPVLVRPSYVLGGRAMRICDGEDDLRAAMAAVSGPVLVDSFVENAIEIDVDALCDGTDVFIGAVMQHVEEAGVHSGDSSCVLPAQSLTLANALEVEHVVRRLGPALGVVGLLNVQLAIADQTVYVLEANPRASRTVPFASKATGVNLVEAACRLAHGERLADLGLTPPRPTEVSVKAAVLPFARFPGADPVLGPEMRSTGEVMATASDLPTAFAKAERAAGRPLPTSGVAFLSVRDGDKASIAPIAAALAGLGFELVATTGTARTLRAAGLDVEEVGKVADAEPGEATVVDLIREHRCNLVVNTPQGSGARADGYLIREAALVARVPCITTISGAAAAVHAIANARAEATLSLQERLVVSAVGGNASREHRAHRTTHRRRERADRPLPAGSSDGVQGSRPERPGQFFMLEAPGRVLPRPFSLCLAPRASSGSSSTRSAPGRVRSQRSSRVTSIRVTGPLGNGFDLSVARPLLVGGGIGVAPFPYLSERLGRPPALLGFRTAHHAEAAALVPNAEVVLDPTLVTDALPDDPGDVLACGPEPMLDALALRVPGAQLACEAPMACGYGACYGCVVPRNGSYVRLCIEGPVLLAGAA